MSLQSQYAIGLYINESQQKTDVASISRVHWVGFYMSVFNLTKSSKDFVIRYPVNNCMFKVNNRNTRTRCEICSKLTMKTTERRQWHPSGIYLYL